MNPRFRHRVVSDLNKAQCSKPFTAMSRNAPAESGMDLANIIINSYSYKRNFQGEE